MNSFSGEVILCLKCKYKVNQEQRGTILFLKLIVKKSKLG